MGKKSLGRKNKTYGRVIVFQALLVTLGIFAAFFVLFSLQPAEASATRREGGRIELLNIGAMKPEEQTRFLRWMAIHDPTVIARADSPASATARLPGADRELPDATPIETLFSPLPGRSVPLPEKQMTSAPSGAWAPDGAPPAAAEGARKEQVYPRILANGVPMALELPPELVAQARTVVAAPAEFEFRTEAGALRRRFSVQKTTGSGKLDLRLIRLLLAELDASAEPDGRTVIRVIWNAEEEKP